MADYSLICGFVGYPGYWEGHWAVFLAIDMEGVSEGNAVGNVGRDFGGSGLHEGYFGFRCNMKSTGYQCDNYQNGWNNKQGAVFGY